MSENPFKIIRSTDLPPDNLRTDVLGSVKMVMLLMRVVQLFVADPGSALFENVRILGRSASSRSGDRTPPPSDPT
ncbi:MAG: hypothetical protein JNL43_03070 [Flavobacteriales bacterium]|nr:hypothetical protein [Flavobacteriales bacterium]HRH70832.1 hypothetical protein [Flavobacteriales bacterium]